MTITTRLLALGGFAAGMLAPALAYAAPVIADGSFETPATGSYVYTPVVPGVTFNAGSGVQRNGSAWGFTNAPDGVQTAFLQSSASFIGQIVFSVTGLVVGQAYTVDFSAAARPGYATNAFSVALNGTTVGNYDTASTAWQSFTTGAFVATGTTASLSFTGSASTVGDNDVGLDRVALAAVPEPATWAMMIVGLGAVGYAMRRRQKVATRVSYAG